MSFPKPTIFGKFLLVLVPSFALVAALGLAAVGRIDARNDAEALGLRIGNLGARIAGALGRHEAIRDRRLAEDFLGTFGTDGAVRCAQLLPIETAVEPLAAYPPVVGCLNTGASMLLSLPVGDTDAVLAIHYSDDELAQSASRRAWIVFSIVLAAFVTTLVSAGIAFRLIVGRRIRLLHAAMTHRTEAGERTELAERGRDELSDMVRAFNHLMRHEAIGESQLNARNDVLADEGRRDPLTGLFNRRHFDRWLLEARGEAHQRQRAGAIGLIDVDHFKRINDTHGHGVGDEVLVALAARLGAATRSADMLVRWGGEEILVHLSGRQDCDEVAQRLLAAVGERPFDTTVGPLEVSASIGLVRLPLKAAGFDLSIERAIVLADRALYAAKGGGRRQAVVVDRLVLDLPAQIGAVENDLLRAAAQGLATVRIVADDRCADAATKRGPRPEPQPQPEPEPEAEPQPAAG